MRSRPKSAATKADQAAGETACLFASSPQLTSKWLKRFAINASEEIGVRADLGVRVAARKLWQMARRYSIAEARKRLSRLVDQAEAGDEILFTRWGKPVAALVSLPAPERLGSARRRFASAYAAFLQTQRLEEIGLEPDFTASLYSEPDPRP